jgi:hypothetical protein
MRARVPRAEDFAWDIGSRILRTFFAMEKRASAFLRIAWNTAEARTALRIIKVGQ